MSSVTVPLYHYALLKGYLAGQNAPNEALAAVEALYMAAVQGPLRADALDAIQAVKEAAERLVGMATVSPPVEVSVAKPELHIVDLPQSAEFDLPPLTRRALEKVAEPVATPEAPGEPQTDEAKIAAFIAVKTFERCPPAHAAGDDTEVVVGPSEPKKRREWSPEARAAAADRMRSRQAEKRGQPAANLPAGAQPTIEIRKPALPTPAHGPTQKPKPDPAIDVDRLITVHKGYAGKRDDGLLVDSDWPDIKTRLAKGEDKKAIAGDYDVEMEELDFFIASNQRREAKQPMGEARAPF